jgi:CheY-like chemotaxis protein
MTLSVGKDVHLLIVDDDQIDLLAIQRSLQKQKIGNPVSTARDGVEALEVLRGSGGRAKLPRPNLILLDLNMPRMNGLQFLDELRKDPNLANTIVFVLTTSAADEDKVAAYKKNIAGYLVKTEAGEGFLRAIQMLDKFILIVQFPPDHA